jgi:hypothetical protein
MFKIFVFYKNFYGSGRRLNAVITVEKVGNFWRITKIETDKGLYAYTGFKA